jgi:hypothetical protein
MATIKIHDRADQVRVEIVGKFAGDTVREVEMVWKSLLDEAGSRQFTVDISRLSGYDAEGRKLLREMFQHGVTIAAKTPLSLVFLNEISSTSARRLAIVSEARPAIRPATKPTNEVKTLRPAAGAE